MVGKIIAHYEVFDEIGAGGMGVVYKAWDTRLERQVAIKALPEELAEEPERLARFEREAKLLAGLKNPHIATVYGLEVVEGRRFLAMELVEGKTLAERIAKGPLPVREALELARQVAEALEEAHTADVIHRDVKPGNIMIDKDGKAKVLDFGLAKALRTNTPEADLSLSPTLTQSMTLAGSVLGTPVYMSPEQIRGEEAGKQSDIWAFGCVLYEMLTGRRPFASPVVGGAEVEPEWKALPRATPTAVRRLLRRCLAKDPGKRLRDIGDARLELDEVQNRPDAEAPGATTTPAWQTPLAVAAVAVVTLVAGVWLGAAWQSPLESTSAPPGAVAQLEIELPAEASLGFGTAALGFDNPLVAISPDGTLIVYVGRSGSGTRLYRRRIDSFDDPEPIEGTDGALFAFFSPGGDWLGFLTDEEVKKVSLRVADRPQTVSKARNPIRAKWAANGRIYFSEDEGNTLSSVPEASGAVTEIDRLGRGGVQTFLSDVLPDGKHALIRTSTESIGSDYADIYLMSLETRERTLLVERGYDARYVPTGHLLFARSGTLYAVPFDASSLAVTGEPLPVVPGVSMASLFGQVQVAFSDNGTLVYVPGGDRSVGRIAAVDRYTNEVEFLGLPERVYGYFGISPDGRRIAVQVADIEDYILIWDHTTETAWKLAAPGSAGWPNWSRDNREIAFSASIPGQGYAIFVTSGDQEPRQIFASEARVSVASRHPDRNILGVQSFDRGSRFGFLEIGADEVDWVSREDAREWGPDFLRDGGSLMYVSNRTGRYEVRVRSYPAGGELDRQVSSNGAIEARACRECDEIFYRDGNRWFSRAITGEEPLPFGPAELVFETDFIDTPGRSYDVSADGQRLFVVKSTRQQTTTRLRVSQNWFEELKRAAPAD